MNIVVTGATSFLGLAMVKKLLYLKHQVFAVVRPGSANLSGLEAVQKEAKRQGEKMLHVIPMELERLDGIQELIGEVCDIFLHFGWDGSGSQNRVKVQVQQKNAEDSMKALEGARRLGCRRFLFSGSQAEYGVHQNAMTEETRCQPVSEYGKAKLEFYNRARQQCDRWKKEGLAEMEYIHARIFSIYGPGDHQGSLVNTCLDTCLRGGHMELGACTQQWNYLYIDDFTEAMVSLMFCHKALTGDGIYNIAGGSGVTVPLRNYVEAIYGICGKRGSFVYGKLAPGAEGPANLIPDISKLTETTGWHPTITFEEGIRRMLNHKGLDRNHTCLVCGHSLPEKPLLVLEGMPAAAQDIPDAFQVTEDQGIDLQLLQCKKCGLVQFDCRPVDYYRDVIRSGGFSTTMVELRKRQYRHLIETYQLEGKRFLEVGSGRGEFLSVLAEFPVEAYGVEHKLELVTIAREQGLNVCYGFTEQADTVLGTSGLYDVFLSFNFLEHQPEPGTMLDCIYENLNDGGMGLITVPSLEYILQHDGYYELIRDHIAYYSFDTLRYLLEHHGFEVLEEEMVNRDTCSVIVRKGKRNKTEISYTPLDFRGLLESREAIAYELKQLQDKLQAQGQTLAVWGASHQGFTLAASTCLKDYAEYIIDSAPFKQGRFAPASHLPIVSPEEAISRPVDVILIVAPGYTMEIASLIRNRFKSQVRIMTLRSNHLEELEEL